MPLFRVPSVIQDNELHLKRNALLSKVAKFKMEKDNWHNACKEHPTPHVLTRKDGTPQKMYELCYRF